MGKYIGFDIESKKTVGVRLGWVHLYFVGNKLFDLSSSAIKKVDCRFISHFGAALVLRGYHKPIFRNRPLSPLRMPFRTVLQKILGRSDLFSVYVEVIRYCPKTSRAYTDLFGIGPELIQICYINHAILIAI